MFALYCLTFIVSTRTNHRLLPSSGTELGPEEKHRFPRPKRRETHPSIFTKQHNNELFQVWECVCARVPKEKPPPKSSVRCTRRLLFLFFGPDTRAPALPRATVFCFYRARRKDEQRRRDVETASTAFFGVVSSPAPLVVCPYAEGWWRLGQRWSRPSSENSTPTVSRRRTAFSPLARTIKK